MLPEGGTCHGRHNRSGGDHFQKAVNLKIQKGVPHNFKEGDRSHCPCHTHYNRNIDNRRDAVGNTIIDSGPEIGSAQGFPEQGNTGNTGQDHSDNNIDLKNIDQDQSTAMGAIEIRTLGAFLSALIRPVLPDAPH